MNHVNYNSISNEKKGAPSPETKDNTVVAPEVEGTKAPETQTEPGFVFGTVANCTRLNIRKEPDRESDVVCIIEKDTQVLVIPEESTDEWYRVDVGGLRGFCMKKYMTTNT